jgi:hypothetical protein
MISILRLKEIYDLLLAFCVRRDERRGRFALAIVGTKDLREMDYREDEPGDCPAWGDDRQRNGKRD